MMNSIHSTRGIPGFERACLIDSHYGMVIMNETGPSPAPESDLEAAAISQAFNAHVQTMEHLGLAEECADVVISTQGEYRLLRALEHHPSLFIYLVLDRKLANLGLARIHLSELGRDFSLTADQEMAA